MHEPETLTEKRQRLIIEELRDEVHTLKETVREMQTQLTAPALTIPVVWRLTPSEHAAFAPLCGRDVVTKEAMYQAMYAMHDDGSLPDLKMVDVWVCKLRKKLKPFGIQILTVWGRGYSLGDRLAVVSQIRLLDNACEPSPLAAQRSEAAE
jgi:two-component system cell cycle response regulator CtrA